MAMTSTIMRLANTFTKLQELNPKHPNIHINMLKYPTFANKRHPQQTQVIMQTRNAHALLMEVNNAMNIS